MKFGNIYINFCHYIYRSNTYDKRKKKLDKSFQNFSQKSFHQKKALSFRPMKSKNRILLSLLWNQTGFYDLLNQRTGCYFSVGYCCYGSEN